MPDSTLSALIPGLPLRVAGERVVLRPVTVAELPIVERVFEGWRLLLVTAGASLNPEAWEDLLELLGAASGKGITWVKALDEDAFETLLSFALAINQEILDPPQANNGDTLTWAQIFQKLIHAGHAWETLRTYTLAQVRAFVEVVAEQEREAFASSIIASSFAMVAPKDSQKIAEKIRRGK